MTGEARPICAQAMSGLKRNSTRLLITMCIGIALAMYGVYVQARSESNPSYMPAVSIASHWLYKAIGKETLKHPGQMLSGCFNKQVLKATGPRFLMRNFILPIVHTSGIINGSINLIQIILLKVYWREMFATYVTIGLSATGFVISMLCLYGAYASCKLMCISCLGIHHVIIIYLALWRGKILQNIHCPDNNSSLGPCNYGKTSGTTGRIFGSSNQGSASNLRARRQSGRL